MEDGEQTARCVRALPSRKRQAGQRRPVARAPASAQAPAGSLPQQLLHNLAKGTADSQQGN